ncbi:MAG: AAA family ATPase [Desulfobulbaceae bacterium]|nr:AAA family ATPase [Desulfobulbaceae bacterium]
MQRIYIFFGMVASGKSTLARRFADRHQLPYYNTDRVRKELAGLTPTSKKPEAVDQGIYSGEFTRQTYRTMLGNARNDLAAGKNGVVLDGSYHRRQDREQVRQTAADLGAGCMFICCTCSDEEVRRRLDMRARDPQAVSDGRWEIYLVQKKSFEPPDELDSAELTVLNTENDVEQLLAKLDAELAMNTRTM